MKKKSKMIEYPRFYHIFTVPFILSASLERHSGLFCTAGTLSCIIRY